MADQPTSTTDHRELTAIHKDFVTAKAEAKKAVEAVASLPENAKATDRKSADEAVVTTTEALEAVKAEFKAAEKAILQAQYDAKQAEYKSATTAGVKAALRRDMNKLREQMGLPALIAGNKSSGPRFDPAVLAILDGSLSIDDEDEDEDAS